MPGVVEKDGSASRRETTGSGYRFPRFCRLTARRQFLAVYDRGGRVGSSSFTLFGFPNDSSSTRIGLTMPRRIGHAARRNRVKRLMRELFRLHRTELLPTYDIVVNARVGIDQRSLLELEREFLSSFKRLVARQQR